MFCGLAVLGNKKYMTSLVGIEHEIGFWDAANYVLC